MPTYRYEKPLFANASAGVRRRMIKTKYWPKTALAALNWINSIFSNHRERADAAPPRENSGSKHVQPI
jgi:hypothetical protein